MPHPTIQPSYSALGSALSMTISATCDEESLRPEPLRSDLRVEPRHCTVADHGILSVRIRPGRAVVLLDVSASGALVEGQHQLRPGTTVDVQMCDATKEVVVRGLVLRSAVVRL